MQKVILPLTGDDADDEDVPPLDQLQIDVNHLPPLFGLEAPVPEINIHAADGKQVYSNGGYDSHTHKYGELLSRDVHARVRSVYTLVKLCFDVW